MYTWQWDSEDGTLSEPLLLAGSVQVLRSVDLERQVASFSPEWSICLHQTLQGWALG